MGTNQTKTLNLLISKPNHKGLIDAHVHCTLDDAAGHA
jgi:hypothetical protein